MKTSTPTIQEIRVFRKTVYRFFSKHGRAHLPWRTDYNPYHILVSEIMLQQTQVDRVIDKFTSFITAFPTVESLAVAPLESVLAQWQGLGYNRRAKSLRSCARTIVEDYNGNVPDDPEKLKKLPGIGTATAASIAAFAFNKPTIFLETNIRTVYIHHFLESADAVDDEHILPIAEAALDRRNARKWYSALMDYGTMLKKEVGNLTRRSVTYKKQSPFAGSRRQVRGRILKTLLETGPLTKVKLIDAVKGDPKTVESLLAVLCDEGLIRKTGRRYGVAH
jgi:A/G-specific adenine glycosylase